MFEARLDSIRFTNALRDFSAKTKVELGDAVKQQALLLAKRLVKLTYPKTSGQGRKRVTRDIRKVYVTNDWFEDAFSFNNKKFGDRVKELTRSKDAGALESVFAKSSRLSRLHIEDFDAGRHADARKNGRVSYKAPYSFPLTNQKGVKNLDKEKRAAVGTAKAGWAGCVSALGGSSPGWLSKGGLSSVRDMTNSGSPTVYITNKARVFAALNEQSNITSRAIQGRTRDMKKSAELALKRSKAAAGL